MGEHGNFYRNREFWCKGYYVDTVGKNTKAIKEYIANQLKKDKESDQLSMFDRTTLLRVASKQCMAGRPILRRTCAQPVSFRAMPGKWKYHVLCTWIFILSVLQILLLLLYYIDSRKNLCSLSLM